MRHEPYARGGCHCRNNVRDTKFLTILVPDVHRSHSIAVIDELLTPFFELANSDRFAAPWTPGEMRDTQVDTLFISLILVSIHVLFIHDTRQQCKG